VISGSSAAALTGLTFVVITLVADVRVRTSMTHEGIATFTSPTITHFCSALLNSAILSAPWGSLTYAATALAIAGLFGVGYIARVLLRARRLTVYTPDVEDWAFYTILPLLAYLTVVGGAFALPRAPVGALFAIAGATLLLIFIGIRNAWDVVTYVAVDLAEEERRSNDRGEQ
jgi:hypothetical protein